jgi:hypothetical protein
MSGFGMTSERYAALTIMEGLTCFSARPGLREAYGGPPYDAHVTDWRWHEKKRQRAAEREARIAEQRERDKPIIDAAAAKRAARNAKRLATLSSLHQTKTGDEA